MEILELLAAPFAACLVVAGLHCYMGIHVVRREIIFVDLALAQVAALGTTVGILIGYEPASTEAYVLSLIFALAGAILFTLGRFRDHRVPQEAIIGIVYAVSSAAAVLVLDRAPHGAEEMKAMLIGSVLFVSWPQVVKLFLLYVVLGAFHFVFWKHFLRVSLDPNDAEQHGLSVRLWDFLFYVTFAIMVTNSVRIAGVLLVFSYLIIPPVCVMLFTSRLRALILFGWGIGFLASVLGLYLSAALDLPTGAALVTTFGLMLVLCALIRVDVRGNSYFPYEERTRSKLA